MPALPDIKTYGTRTVCNGMVGLVCICTIGSATRSLPFGNIPDIPECGTL
jgi:hypothetical protein